LGDKQALHVTHALAASSGVWLRDTETEISATLLALVAREGL